MVTHIHLQKLGKDAWAHTLYEHIWVMYTHIRAVANVCLSVCLALRGTVLISVKQYMELCCTVCGRVHSVFALSVLWRSTHSDTKRQRESVCAGGWVCVWGKVNQKAFILLFFSKCAPIVAGSRFRGAHPQGGAAGTPRRERSTGSPRMTSGLKSTSLPGPHPPVRSEVPSPQRPGSEPGNTGSWAERCPPPSPVWSLPLTSHRTGGTDSLIRWSIKCSAQSKVQCTTNQWDLMRRYHTLVCTSWMKLQLAANLHQDGKQQAQLYQKEQNPATSTFRANSWSNYKVSLQVVIGRIC